MEPPLSENKYPAWVIPHDSHIVRPEGQPIVTPFFSEHHVDRDTKQVTVLVADEEEEARALAEPGAAPEPAFDDEQKDA